MKHINFPQNKQTLFLRLIKSKTNFSWKKLAQFLNINRSMIYFYLNEHSKLPFDSYKKLCKLTNIKIKNVKLIEIKNKEEEINLPKLDKFLSEFLGALAGDGHMNNITYEVSISLDKDLDKKYAIYILDLFKDLFNIKARTYIQKESNKIKCFVYSKRLVNFLSKEYGVPIGKKKGKLNIPFKVLCNNSFLRCYIRGVFDTDGSFHRHHEKDAMLGLISMDKKFIVQLQSALTKLNFTSSLSDKNLYIYKKLEIDRFFGELMPSNYKHIFKYEVYKKRGTVPLTKELIKR